MQRIDERTLKLEDLPVQLQKGFSDIGSKVRLVVRCPPPTKSYQSSSRLASGADKSLWVNYKHTSTLQSEASYDLT